MTLSIRRFFGLITTLLALCAVHACAVEPKGPVFHSFDFGTYGDNQGIEILNYRYGNSKLAATQAPAWELATGHIEQGNGIGGTFPVGESLYVKWRVTATSKVYEDTVYLKGRLPSDMDHKIIHFSIKGSQLYVYVIEGNSSAQLHVKDAPDCPTAVYKSFKCSKIYPDHWANF